MFFFIGNLLEQEIFIILPEQHIMNIHNLQEIGEVINFRKNVFRETFISLSVMSVKINVFCACYEKTVEFLSIHFGSHLDFPF